MALWTLLALASCDSLFVNDGDQDAGITSEAGYFYCIDNGSYTLKMFDRNLELVASWSLESLIETTSFQGITFDGSNLWLSVAGGADLIYRVDASTDSLVVLNSFDAPPTGRGTVRDIAWDGSYLWALNSGSETYGTPPTLYKLNPDDGSVLSEIALPGPEPRGLCYVGANSDAYGSGLDAGLYIADVTLDSVYAFRPDKQVFQGAFKAPQPPAGASYIFPNGLSFDGRQFWLINSSSVADYLYELKQNGMELNRIELSFDTPGPIVWSTKDARIAPAPEVTGVSPNTGTRGAVLSVVINGAHFLPGSGLEVSFGAGIVVQTAVFQSGSAIRADIEITDDAEFGARDVTVTNPDGQVAVGTGVFTILNVDPNAGYLWFTDAYSDSLYKVKVSNDSIVAGWSTLGVAPGGSTQGLTYDGTYIWISAGGTDDAVMRLNTSGATLSSTRTFTAPPAASGVIRDLAFDGEYLWACNSTSAHIYKMDTLTGAVLDSIGTPGVEARGIVYADGHLYCNDYQLDSVYQYDFGTSTWTAQFVTPIPPNGTTSDRYATGMAWDGANFWIANSTFEFDYIFQVSTNGTVLKTYEVPNRGNAQPTGITFTQE